MINVLVFGTGDLAARANDFLNLQQITIQAYISECATSLEQQEFYGKKVIPLQDIPLYDVDYIFIASIYYQTITTKLLARGINKQKIVHLHMIDHAIDAFWALKGPRKSVEWCLRSAIDSSPILSQAIVKERLMKHLGRNRWQLLDYIFILFSLFPELRGLLTEAPVADVCGIRYPRAVIERFKYFPMHTDILLSYVSLSERERATIGDETFGVALPARPGSMIEGYEFGPVHIKPGDTIIDCGASVGFFSGFAAYRTGDDGRVFAFEPIPFNRNFLEQTASCYNNITIVPHAVYNTTQQLQFNVSLVESHPVSMRAGAPARQLKQLPQNYIDVNAVSLDQWALASKIEKIDFIKADIEGAERHLIEGAQHILKKMAPKLAICKYHLPDDLEVLRKLIIKANPKYVFIAREDVLFAYVPDN